MIEAWNIKNYSHPREAQGKYLEHRAQLKKQAEAEAKNKLKQEPWRQFKTRQIFSIECAGGRLHFLFLFQENELNLMVNELDDNKKPKSQNWVRLPIANIKDCQVHN